VYGVFFPGRTDGKLTRDASAITLLTGCDVFRDADDAPKTGPAEEDGSETITWTSEVEGVASTATDLRFFPFVAGFCNSEGISKSFVLVRGAVWVFLAQLRVSFLP
jgi:hypothetical protein